jgi:hypothetical protein
MNILVVVFHFDAVQRNRAETGLTGIYVLTLQTVAELSLALISFEKVRCPFSIETPIPKKD